MTILEALKRLRDDLKLWVTNNLNTKVDKSDSALTTESKTVIGAINELNEEINNVSSLEVSDTQPTEENVDLWINHTAVGEFVIPEVNDATTSTVDTWSSKKISDELANAGGVKTVNGVAPDADGNVEIKVSTEDVNVDLSDYYTKDEVDAAAGEMMSYLSASMENKVNSSDLNNYYTKNQMDAMEFITLDDIDAICGTVIQDASVSEVTF